jgi:tetratricopeptide (TPR) repeat protein
MKFRLDKLHIFSLILLGSMTGTALGQDSNKIDSLKKRLQGLGGIERFETLKQLFYLYSSYDYSKMYEVSEDALNTALKGTDSLLIIKAYRMNGNALTQLTDNVRAISMFKRGLEIVERNSSDPKTKDQEKYILNSIALSYLELGNYSKALDYNYLSLAIREKEENEQEVSISLNNLGLVYYRLNDYQKAIEYYAKCLLLRDRLGLNEDYDKLVLVNLALCYIGVEDFEKALVYGKKVLGMCRSGCSREVEREANSVIGLAYLKSNQFDEAELYFNQSLSIANSQNDVSAIVINMINLSKVDLAGGHTQRALVHLHEAEQVIKDVEYPIVMLKIYQAFVDTYQLGGDKLQASTYQGKYL